ncbi:hypothetical protein VPH35_112109 [Triticum aestivum]
MGLSSVLLLALLLLPAVASAGHHDYGDALHKSILFFEGQRSGRLPPDQRLRWRRDSGLHDGAAAGVDLTGGYYDAGDNVKFGFPMAFTATLMSWGLIDFGRSFGPHKEEARKAVRWATDYFMKATAKPNTVYVQVGDAFKDHSCWERPEDMDTPRTVYKVDPSHPGSDVAAETAAALAAGSIVFRDADPVYSQRLLDRAMAVFKFADRYRGAYSSSLHAAVCPCYCDFDGYQDELLWAAAWLHKASRKRVYRQYIKKNEVVLGASDSINEFGWDNKHAGINVLISKEVLMGKDEYFQSFRANANNFMCTLLPGISDHPQIQYSPGLLHQTQQEKNGLLVNWWSNQEMGCRRAAVQGRGQQHAARDVALLPHPGLLQLPEPRGRARLLRRRQVCAADEAPAGGQAAGGLHPRGQPAAHVLHGRLRAAVPAPDPPPRQLHPVRGGAPGEDRVQGRRRLLRQRGA